MADNIISNGDFQVEEYRMPAFDVGLKGATAWHGADRDQDISLSAGLRFLAGGAAAGQQVTLRGSYRGGADIPDYDYRFEVVEHVILSIDAKMHLEISFMGRSKAIRRKSVDITASKPAVHAHWIGVVNRCVRLIT